MGVNLNTENNYDATLIVTLVKQATNSDDSKSSLSLDYVLLNGWLVSNSLITSFTMFSFKFFTLDKQCIRLESKNFADDFVNETSKSINFKTRKTAMKDRNSSDHFALFFQFRSS